jgi:hypothetical protein
MTTYRKSCFTIALGTIVTVVLSPALARGDTVLEWNAIMQTTVSAQAPFPQARSAAITQLAVFEAVNAITHDYNPYLGTVTAPPGASAEAAAVAAAYTILTTFFPGQAATLTAARSASLAAIPDTPAKSAGITVGQSAALAVMAARANDNSAPPQFYLPTSAEPGKWQTTPSCSAAGGAFFQWRNVTPFAIPSVGLFPLDPPPALTSVKYARDYNEVKEVGGINSLDRPQDRADAARFYAAVSPVGIWNPVARQLSAADRTSLSENARALALLNMAMSDAAVATFENKYRYVSWRPETAIHLGDTDGNPRTNPDPSFAPFIVTPCFPSYPSAHAALSNAAREVLEHLYTSRLHSFVLSTPALPGLELTYNSLKQITDDIDDARVYGGIHFRFDQEGGADLGRRIGKFVHSNNLVPARPHGSGGELEQR